MELKKNNEEPRGLRSDLTAQMGAKDQALFAYMRFLGATVRLAEPLVVRELPAAVSGDDSDRVAWAVKKLCSDLSRCLRDRARRKVAPPKDRAPQKGLR